jgi:hypothetical protein
MSAWLPTVVFLFVAPPDKAGQNLFGLDRVVPLHLALEAKQWDQMQPAPGQGGFGPPGGFPGFGPPGAARPAPDDAHRNTFGVDFPWAQGAFTHDGKTYDRVGVRYKGNFTYIAATGLKKSLKIDLNRNVPKQNIDGLKKLNLNNGITDPSMVREVVSYAFFRAAGVPAPRTGFAELTLTVPGKYDKEYVGLYTLVEQVDKTFLKHHFGDGSGMLLKPEGLQGGLGYLGSDWAAYERRYRPKDEPKPAQKKRLIEFTRLIDRADDATFVREVGDYLEVEACFGLIAANALLSNMDSYLGFGHNFYLYLNPKTNQFMFIPWDCDLSLGAWPVAGTPEQQVDLSLDHPHAGTNKLIDRLFATPKHKARYRAILKELAEGPFTRERLRRDLKQAQDAIKDILPKEKKAAAARKEGGRGPGGPGRPGGPGFGFGPPGPGFGFGPPGPGFGFGPPGPGGAVFGASLLPDAFLEKRVDSVTAQLAGKRKGYVPRSMPFGPR